MKHAVWALLAVAACGGPAEPDGGVGDAAPGDAAHASDGETAVRDDTVDRDGDGIVDSLDAFPDDASEHVDSNGDGVGNAAERDEDGDGVDDLDDELPFDGAASTYPSVTAREPDDTSPTTVPSWPARFSGEVSTTDADRFALDLPAGTIVTFAIESGGVDVVLELASSSGARRAHARARAPARLGAIGYAASDAETIQLVVRAPWSAAPVAYRVIAFADGDLDAVDDAREIALSGDPYSADRDDDGVLDASELVPPLDADGDGAPNWRDADADADGLADRVEGDSDADGDGVPAHLDLDADGDGALDAPPARDRDGDGRIDTADADDDGDGLRDVVDPDPLVFEASYDPLAPDRVLVTSIASRMQDGEIVEGVARGGATLMVRGVGFGTDPAAVEVIARAEAEALSLPAATVLDDFVEVELPGDARVSEVWVRVDGRRSAGLSVHPSRRGDPLLARLDSTFVTQFGTNTVRGYDLADAILFGDREQVMRTVSQTDSSIEFEVRTAGRGGIYARSTGPDGELDSNRLPFVRTQTSLLTVALPAGTSLSLADLEITGALGRPVPVTGSRNIIELAEGGELVTAIYPGAGGADSLFLMTLAPSGPLSAVSTAVSLLMMSTDLLTRPGYDLDATFRRAAALPELQSLGAHLESSLAANPRFLDAPDATYQTLYDAAAEAFRTTVIGESTSAPVRPPASITPEQEDVLVYETEGGGDVGVENDTMLYLSARVLDAEDETRVFRDHITGPLDLGIIGTQSGALLLFDASRVDLGVPAYRNATVEVLTPGMPGAGVFGADARTLDARFFLILRTFVDRAICPALTFVTGRAAPNNLVLQAILQQLPDAVQSARALYVAGDGAAALSALIAAVKADFESVGPLTQAIAFGIGVTIVTVLDQFARKIASALVPAFGQIAAAAQIVSEGATAANVGKYLADVATTSPLLRFDVTWELFVDRAVPNYIEVTSGDRRIYVSGGNFSPEVDAAGARVLPEVTLGDYTTRPISVDALGREMTVVLPRAVIAANEGRRLDVRVTHRGETATLPEAIRITDGYSLDELVAPQGPPGAEVWLRGGVFTADPRRVFVDFSSTEDLTDITAEIHRAPVISTSPTEIRVLAPREITAGRTWYVRAWVGPDGFHEPTNPLPFEVVAPGTWVVRRHGTEIALYDDVATVHFNEQGRAEPSSTIGPWFWHTTWSEVTPERARCVLSLNALTCCPAGDYDVEIDLLTGHITGTFYSNMPSPRRGTVEGRWYPLAPAR